MTRGKKSRLLGQLWAEATTARKALAGIAAIVVTLGAVVVAWGNISRWREDTYVQTYGARPHASAAQLSELEQYTQVLAQFTQSELNARQVQRQLQIDELKARCAAGRCDARDRAALNNLLEQWQREQVQLDQLRQRQQRR